MLGAQGRLRSIVTVHLAQSSTFNWCNPSNLGQIPNFKLVSLSHSDSVSKHLPMRVTDDMDGIPISKLYPPPQLHTGILGPVNDSLKSSEKITTLKGLGQAVITMALPLKA